MRTGEGMTKKMNRRSIAYIVSVVAVLLVIAAVLTVFFTVRHHEKLLDRRDEAIAELTARRGEYDESRIVLADTSEDKAKALADRLGAHLRITKDGRFAVLSLPEGTTIIDVYAADENLGELSSMSADYRVNISELSEEEADTGRIPVRPQHTVSDSAYNLQTYLDYLNLKNVWNYTCASGITVAIIDTGIDTDHPEFAGRISEYSYNATEDKIVKDYTGVDGGYDWSLIEDEQGHGTAVAGVIGASMNSGAIVGVAPEVTLLVIKAECDESGAFKRTSDLVFGLYYAIERDVNVVNMSFGINSNNPFAAATQLAVDSDIICVAAAGNDATASLTYPAADPNVFGVGALEADGWNLASYSNYGENVNFVAPGTVYTTKMGGGYGSMNGTSFASPITAGVMALYLSQNRYSEFITVREILYASCYDLGDLGCDWYYGYGALDVSAFILEERGTVTFNMLTDELENTKQTFIRSHTLQSIPEPERLYAIFDGWYYDPQCTDEYNLYSDKFVSDLTLYANWVNEEDGIPYTYVELPDGTIEIRSYTGHRRYLTIPDYIDGKVVSSIGVGAFEGETRIREINLPKYLVRICDNAFAGCNNLLNIKIPDTVTEISVKAFYDDVRLSYVAFGEGSALTKIEPYAFGGCSKLTRFELPASLTDVNGTAFFGTTSMTAFTVAKGSKTFTARDGVLMNIGEDAVICYPAGLYGEYKVPDSVSMIGVYAFACSKITQIDLNKAEYIGSSAFMYSSLESLIIPDGVKLLGDKAFASCYRLRAVKLGAGLTNISSEAFSGCSALPEIEIPANIVSIGEKAFFGTYSMTRVTFAVGGRLSEIAFEAFAGSGLVSVEIPASVTELGGGAFSGCSALSAVTFGEGSSLTRIEASTFSGDSRLSSVTLPESIVYIGSGAFAGDISLTEITLPSGLVYLGDFAFESTGLMTVAIPKTVETFGIGAFASCHSLTDINVDEENAKYIDIDGVVYDRAMSTLIEYPAGNARTSYTLADGIVTVGQYAFCGSWNLQRVTLSQTVETVDEYAFYDCRSITSYTLSDVLTYIKRYAFAMNSSLRSMAMPDSLMQISNYAFMQDWSLSSVTFTENSRLPRISFGAFAYCGLQSFRVPASVSTMAQGAFIGCSNLYSFTFAAGSGLESISAYMFDGCTNLRTVTFESGSALTSIQAHGFEGMRKLTSVDFGDAKVTNIDNFAFRFCESLKNFTIPDGVTFLGRYAFYYCTALESVTVPASMDFIGRYAFLGTNKISIYFAAETLPPYLAEDWDHGITGYYLGVTDVVTDGEWKYAKLTDGGIAILGYSGTDTNINLTALDFGGNIVNIGGSAFEYSAVESIRLPETLITIQARAFYHSALKSINIPAGTEFIGREAFSDTPIEALTFADGAKLTVIERSAFENTKHLGSVIIPASLKQMGRAAFKNSGITALAFADGFSLAEIPEEAFAYTAITAVRIPDSVTLINHGAFRNTADLETVTFGAGENLTLGSNAFYSSGLKTLEIPANMTYIGEYAFVGLGKLGEFKVAESNPYYKAVDGLLVSKSGRKLIAVPAGREGSLTLPVGIEVIGFGAFESSKLSQILFIDNANILSFGYCAFFGMKNIHEISIPASVVAIDYYAFANCTALEKVTFAEENLLRGVYEGAFYGCKSLREISLPDSVVEISDFAFYGCRRLTALPVSDTGTLKGIYSYGMAYTGLTELNLPETVVDIDSYAFKGTRLKSVTIPDANAKQLIIGIGAFEDCNELEEITLPFIGAEFEGDDLTWLGYIFGAGSYEANSTYVPESLKKVTISEGITSIGEYAFYQLLSIEEISVPHSVTTIYWEAFADTTARYELTNTITTVSWIDSNGTMYYKANQWHFSRGLTGHLELSNKVTMIDGYAFRNCSSLTSITIPDSVTSIGYSAFEGCSSLTSIAIPDSVTSIGAWAFNGCSSLTSITIPDSVTSICSYAFSWCTGLTSITIPDSVRRIGGGAFNGCTNLKSVIIGSGLEDLDSSTFNGCQISEIKIFEQNENFKLVDGVLYNKDLTLIKLVLKEVTNIEIPATITNINSAFSGCSSLTSITIPDSVTSIGNSAFSGCSSLTSITIPDSVTSIGNYAFYFCTSLASITIPDGITSIGDQVLYGCTSLTSITIPDSVTSIDEDAFSGCSSLTSITIPDSVTSIEHNAFWGCENLYTIYNKSNFNFEFGGLDHGRIAEYAKIIVDKNGNKRYKNGKLDFEIIDTADDFRFIKENGEYKLIAYLGKKDTVTLPKNINGNSYIISSPKGICNVIIPDGITDIGSFLGCKSLTGISIPNSVTRIGDSSFGGCTSLTSITIPDSITSIGDQAFSGCDSLTSITIPNSVTNIGSWVFENCISLASITIPDSVTSIGGAAFNDTAYYNNTKNWENGTLHIGKHLIQLLDDATDYVSRGGAIAQNAFEGGYKLKKLTIGGNLAGALSWLTNLETLVLTELPTHYILNYFDGTSDIPITLKNIVLTDGVRMRSNAFYGITGVTIYVAANEKDVRWDENFPGWNNGNKVVYGDKWITADFYDKDGNIISSDILLTSQIVRQPYVTSMMDDTYYYEFLGWDIDGDGIDDVVPATSSSNISAHAVFSKEHKCAAAGHTYGAWSSDATNHWLECSVCHDKKDIASHIFDNACDTTCNACGYVRSITHSYEQKHDENSHWDECTVCGDKQNVTAHIFDNACDTTCDTCGYVRIITHNYEQKHDETNHWDECSVCHNKKDITAHIFDNACDATCDTCGYTRAITHSYEQKHDEANHWDECKVCGDRQNITAHIFDNACDTTCDTCGYARSITHSYEQKHDEDSHWDECSVCHNKKDIAAHIFDNACDTTCDACGYVRSITHNYEQKYDENSHWDECTVCGDKQNITAHTNTKNKHICDTCGRKLSNHEGGTATCSEKAICTICGEKYGNFAEHSFGEWKTNAEGKRTKACSACGKIINFMYGDLNYDGKVTAIDLTILRRYLARYSSEIDIAVADFNGDGKVNTLDLMLLRRFLVGYDSVLGK